MTQIKETLFKIASEFPAARLLQFANNNLANYIRNDAQNNIEQVLLESTSHLIVKGSMGQGVWADIPWLAIMDPFVTKTTTKEYYVVYLFSMDGKEIYLSLAQGVTEATKIYRSKWKHGLESRSIIIRNRVPTYKQNFTHGNVFLKGTTLLARQYESAPAFYKKYTTASIPAEEELVSDLEKILSLYNDLIVAGGTRDLEPGISTTKKSNQTEIIEQKYFNLHKKAEGRANLQPVKNHHGYNCKACGLDFVSKYGDLGREFIEAHHLIPFKDLASGEGRKLNIENDFTVLCSNCHRMIHRLINRTKDKVSVEDLKAILHQNN
ncbi:MAG: DUF3578 domain-containing protein [Oleispira sp.]|nr:DUF3578 domain-containing protein [Oleispira sp.]